MSLKVERGNRVFPVSDHSSDIIGALSREMYRLGVEVKLHTEVKSIVAERKNPGDEKPCFCKIILDSGKVITGDACIVATGGDFLCIHRIYRRRLSICKRNRTSGYRVVSVSCANGG